MTSEEALSLSEMSQGNNKFIIRKKSLDNLLKNKYITYSEEELTTMNDKIKDEILQLDEENKKLKQGLTKLVEKLNTLIKSNSEILFREQDSNSIKKENLEKIYYLRKHDHSLSIKYNKTFKQKYNTLKIKNKELGSSEDLAQRIVEKKTNLKKMANENIELNKQIQEIQFKNLKQTKELENSKFILKSENNLQNYTQLLNDSSLIRFQYFNKIEIKKKSVEKLKKQLKSLNEYITNNQKKIKESNKAEQVLAKINSEINILKKDLDKNVEEIIQNCYDDKISLIENNYLKNINNKNGLNKSNSQQNILLNNKSPQLKALKNLQHSQSSIFNNSVPDNNNLIKKQNNIKAIKNLDSIRTKNRNNLSVFSKFKILKTNKPLRLVNPHPFNQQKNISMFVTKEVIDFNKKSFEEDQLKEEIKNIDENDYQQLIELKGNYLDINDRLDKDIKDKKRICLNRINKLNICIENNLMKLDKIKKINEMMKKDLEEFEQKMIKK